MSRASQFFSLDAEKALLAGLGDPQNDLSYIHVAGTNGKGSTCAYIASILQEAGLRVGCYTSPFLSVVNEMFVIDGERISDEELGELKNSINPYADELAAQGMAVSEYEMYTVMAIEYFKRQSCDIVVIEVNMGGSVDTTNVIPTPLVTVITPISYDHMGMLGDTLTEIATEKAGIIKVGTAVVSAVQEDETISVLESVCAERKVPIEYIRKPEVIARAMNGQTFLDKRSSHTYETSLLGTYQPENAALALLAVDKLKDAGFVISDDAKREGIKKTRWFGRFTMIADDPPVIVDGGHNRQGAAVLRESLESFFPGKKITYILGILRDKEVDAMLDILLPIAKEVYTIDVPNERTMSAEELAKKVQKRNINAHAISDINEYRTIAKDSEVVCIAGSLYSLGMLGIENP